VIYALSVSGGKDSGTMWSWAKRTGLTRRVAIACDTWWEAKFKSGDVSVDWRAYLAELSAAIGEPVEIVTYDSDPCRDLMRVNDDHMSESKREAEVVRIFAAHGVAVAFVDDLRPTHDPTKETR
jgi:tRNA(Ile)-lysidine synthase TilS/MesJ